MASPVRHLPKTRTATVDLLVGGQKVRVQVTAPTGLTAPAALLPQFESVTDAVVAAGVKAVEAENRRISCKKGCGACCRQLVPISGVEARKLRTLVNEMPERRRAEILARFDSAKLRLGKAGVLDKLLAPESIKGTAVRRLGLDYFFVGVACPFLDDESCSIHKDRPLACREYLVTSPAEHCANPAPEKIQRVKLPVQVSKAVRRLTEDGDGASWVPLILALDWADAHPPKAPRRTGIEWVELLFKELSGSRRESEDEAGPQPEEKRKPWWRFW